MPLTDIAVRHAKARSKPYKTSDSGGLFLHVMPHGGKWWRFKYHYFGKEKLLSLGVFPDVSLKDARNRRDAERKKLAEKIDSAVNRKLVKLAWADSQANSFEVVAREWIAKKSRVWSDSNTAKTTRRLEIDVFPWLGRRPISGITPPELLTVLRRTEARGAIDTAHRVMQTCGQIFRYAIATGRAMRDPAADLRGTLQPVKGSHFAATTEPKAAGALLRAIHDYQGSVITRCALRMAPFGLRASGRIAEGGMEGSRP